MIMRPLTLSEQAQKINKKEIKDITDTLPKNPNKRWPTRSKDDIKRIVVHHFASEAPIKNQALYHINFHGWAGLAYHLVVVGDQLYQTNDLLSLTSHAKGANDIGVGISVLADLSKRNMTAVERNTLYSGILTLRALFPHAIIQGHNEASWELAKHATSCPCTDMNKIRKDVAKLEEPTTPELTDVLDNTASAKLAQVYAAYTRFSDLYKTATVAGPYQEEAQRKIALVSDMMVSAGVLVK